MCPSPPCFERSISSRLTSELSLHDCGDAKVAREEHAVVSTNITLPVTAARRAPLAAPGQVVREEEVPTTYVPRSA
jgi:hypothetical protein